MSAVTPEIAADFLIEAQEIPTGWASNWSRWNRTPPTANS
jgi:hypothetical protein